MDTLSDTNPLDIAWAAGLFEGEGCFSFSKVRNKPYPQAMLKTTDHDVITRFHAIVKVGEIYPVKPRKTSTGRAAKPAWNWKTSGEDAGVVAEMLIDHLGTRRHEAAQAILDNLAQRTKTCIFCERPFVAKRSFAEVCSRECRDKVNHKSATERYRALRAQGVSPEHARRLRSHTKSCQSFEDGHPPRMYANPCFRQPAAIIRDVQSLRLIYAPLAMGNPGIAGVFL